MRFFESIERELCIVNKEDVRDTLKIVAERNSTGQTRTRDGEMRFGPAIPKSIFWHPAMDPVQPSAMDKNEREDYYKAYGNVFSKFRHDTKKRGIIV